MSATPHNGKEADFQLFMGLLDTDCFEGRFRQGVEKADMSDTMRRLTNEELYRFDGTKLFPERRAHTANFALSASQHSEKANVVDRVIDGQEFVLTGTVRQRRRGRTRARPR